jgi:hypothetical protein
MTTAERNAVAVEVLARVKVYLRDLAAKIDVDGNEDGFTGPAEEAQAYYIGKRHGIRVAVDMLEHHADKF